MCFPSPELARSADSVPEWAAPLCFPGTSKRPLHPAEEKAPPIRRAGGDVASPPETAVALVKTAPQAIQRLRLLHIGLTNSSLLLLSHPSNFSVTTLSIHSLVKIASKVLISDPMPSPSKHWKYCYSSNNSHLPRTAMLPWMTGIHSQNSGCRWFRHCVDIPERSYTNVDVQPPTHLGCVVYPLLPGFPPTEHLAVQNTIRSSTRDR